MIFEGEIALVTGASRGIGKAIAAGLAGRGATVIGTATTEKGAKAISEYLESSGLRGEGQVLEVTDPESISRLMDHVTKAHGPVTILVNNAGITRDNLLMRMKDDEWDRVIDTNLNSIYRLSKACLRGMMKKRHGRIINIASVVGAMGNAGQTNYAAAKAGMAGFARALAREVGSRAITVNTIAPGFIATDMTAALPEAQRDALLAQIPLNRLGAPEEIAAVVAFLASADAAYITGETLHVNGGMYMS